MIDINQLRQLMEFYKQNNPSTDYSAHNGFNPTPYNPNGEAMTWATGMLNGGGARPGPGPDFFAGQDSQGGNGGSYQPSQYVQPQRFNGSQPAPNYGQSPLTGQVNNFLARIMGRR